MPDLDYQQYLFREKDGICWVRYVNNEPDLEQVYRAFMFRVGKLTHDQKEYLKDHKSYRDRYSYFLKLTLADFHRQVESVNAEDLLMHHVVLSVMLMRYWEFKVKIH